MCCTASSHPGSEASSSDGEGENRSNATTTVKQSTIGPNAPPAHRRGATLAAALFGTSGSKIGGGKASLNSLFSGSSSDGLRSGHPSAQQNLNKSTAAMANSFQPSNSVPDVQQQQGRFAGQHHDDQSTYGEYSMHSDDPLMQQREALEQLPAQCLHAYAAWLHNTLNFNLMPGNRSYDTAAHFTVAKAPATAPGIQRSASAVFQPRSELTLYRPLVGTNSFLLLQLQV